MSKLKQEIQAAVERFCRESIHRDTVIQALCRSGFALNPESSCQAGLLTLEICRSISGEFSRSSVQAATAVELIMEAGFMFDNVADEEVDSTHGLTPPEELALAITLLSCGVAVAHEAVSSVKGVNGGIEAVMQIQINSVAACAGQFLDAFMQKSDEASTEQSLNMTRLKSGSIGKLAGEFSASVCSDDPEIVSLFGEFGFNLFTYMQLIDDLRDAMPIGAPATDFAQNKKTLPLVFFHNTVKEALSGNNSGIMPDNSLEPGFEARRLFDLSGSGSFCAIVAESYLNRAKLNLTQLQHKLITVKNLERLVGSLEISPQEIPIAS